MNTKAKTFPDYDRARTLLRSTTLNTESNFFRVWDNMCQCRLMSAVIGFNDYNRSLIDLQTVDDFVDTATRVFRKLWGLVGNAARHDGVCRRMTLLTREPRHFEKCRVAEPLFFQEMLPTSHQSCKSRAASPYIDAVVL